MDLFAKSEVPSLCLRDRPRTEAFRAVIRRAVRPGDVVLDAGCGSGVLSLFAAAAGARAVFALDADPYQVELLRRAAEANGFGGVVRPLVGDARTAPVSGPVDVLIAEMIDTWLLDEHQVPAVAALQARGVLAPGARVVPAAYEAVATFGTADFAFYGFRLPYPLHDWPDLDPADGWHPTGFTPLADPVTAFRVDFAAPVHDVVDVRLTVTPTGTGTVNAVRLSGVTHLDGESTLGPTLAFNGDKVFPLDPLTVVAGRPVELAVRARLGAGLGSLQIAPPPIHIDTRGTPPVCHQTRRVHSWLSPKCAVRPSPLDGLGVFATEPLAQGEAVAVLGGKVLTADEVEALGERHPEYQWKTFSVWDGVYIAPFEPDSPPDDTEAFNHSCEPNLGVRGQVVLVARRAVGAGEELTFDYDTTETSAYGGFECNCGTPSCRRVIDGTSWRNPEWVRQHFGFLSTYIVDRVIAIAPVGLSGGQRS